MKDLLLLLFTWPVMGADISALMSDREAVERVYYNHRTGEKLPFDKTLSRDQLRELVERDLAKEFALKKRYAVDVSDAQVAAEVARINSTTRAPEVLAEIKAALGNDPVRFARTVARPLVVERLLRARFQDDDALHATQRRAAENLRTSLLALRDGSNGVPRQMQFLRTSHAGVFSETTWRLERRTAEEKSSSDRQDANSKLPQRYFDELPRDLQNVLRSQLNASGDVSAVIEAPDGFLLFVARKKSGAELAVASINIPKRDYEQWLGEQTAARTLE